MKTILIAQFDAKWLIHYDYVPPNETVNAAYYIEVLKYPKCQIQRVWPEYKVPGSWSLLDDNALIHLAIIVKHYLAKN